VKTAIGLDVGGTKISGVLINESGDVLLSCNRASDYFGSDYIKNIASIIEYLIKNCSTDIEGIGVGIPGIVDSYNGIVKHCPAFNWNDIPLKSQIENKFEIKTYIENDVNSWTLSEKYLGVAKNCNNFVMITIGTGIGCGLWINGQIYRGSTYESGEIGYMPLNTTAYNKQYHYNDFGFFESKASAFSIYKAYNKDSNQGIDCKAIFQNARENDQTAKNTVEEAYDYLGLGVSCISCLLNPEIIVIGGGISKEGEELLVNIKKRIKRLIPIETNLSITGVGINGGAIGSGLTCFLKR